MKLVEESVKKIRAVINYILESVSKKDIFYAVAGKFRVVMELPFMDCEKRWSSTLDMKLKAYYRRRVIIEDLQLVEEWNDLYTSEAGWTTENKLQEFLIPFDVFKKY